MVTLALLVAAIDLIRLVRLGEGRCGFSFLKPPSAGAMAEGGVETLSVNYGKLPMSAQRCKCRGIECDASFSRRVSGLSVRNSNPPALAGGCLVPRPGPQFGATAPRVLSDRRCGAIQQLQERNYTAGRMLPTGV